MILPIIIFNSLFFIGGIILGIKNSFGSFYLSNGWIYNNQFLLRNPFIIKNLIFTAKLAVIVTLMNIIISLFIIYILFKYDTLNRLIKRIFYLPLLTPYVLVAFFMIYTFSSSGFFNRILYHLGIIKSYTSAPYYINDTNGIGIVLAYLWKTVPFMSLILLSTLEQYNEKYTQIAASLGASLSKIFFSIVLPQVKPTIIYSSLIIMTYVFSAIEIPLILGPTSPKTLSQWAYLNFQSGPLEFQSVSLAVNNIILAINIIISVIVGYYFLRSDYNKKKN